MVWNRSTELAPYFQKESCERIVNMFAVFFPALMLSGRYPLCFFKFLPHDNDLSSAFLFCSSAESD